MAEAVLKDAPTSFSLAGFSIGGRVALEMIRRAPERILRLALIGSSVHPLADGEAARRQPMIDMAREHGMGAVAASWIPRLVPAARHDDAELMLELRDMTCRFSAEDYADEVHALLNRPDPRPLLAGIRCPALVLAGREDPLSTPERNTDLAARIPGARLLLIDGCGHFPMLEAPDATNAALLAWLGAGKEAQRQGSTITWTAP
jgi:pimeloyl-ACP methyl ester carboxylesterase